MITDLRLVSDLLRFLSSIPYRQTMEAWAEAPVAGSEVPDTTLVDWPFVGGRYSGLRGEEKELDMMRSI